MNTLKLLSKKKLTPDVYELIFDSNYHIDYKPGQFIIFKLPSGLTRAYSIAYTDGSMFVFIVKRLENGRGGSKELCDLELGTELNYNGPIGEFFLQNTSHNKLFIGTGTGFAPLYFQIKKCLEYDFNGKIGLIFGVRYLEDVFYYEILSDLVRKHSNFSFCIYLSRGDFVNKKLEGNFLKGYVTDFIQEKNVSKFDEFYICGSNQMVDDAKKALIDLHKTNIYAEKY